MNMLRLKLVKFQPYGRNKRKCNTYYVGKKKNDFSNRRHRSILCTPHKVPYIAITSPNNTTKHFQSRFFSPIIDERFNPGWCGIGRLTKILDDADIRNMLYQKFTGIYSILRRLNSNECEKCAAINIAAARFCGGCGNRLDQKKPRSTKTRLIYASYMIILMMAVTWRLVNAESSISSIEKLSIFEKEGLSSISILLNRPYVPLVDFDAEENRLNLVFQKTAINETLLNKPFIARNLRMGYLANDEKGQKAFARIFLKQNCLSTVSYDKNQILISVAHKKTAKRTSRKQRSLINPGDEKHSPALINLNNAPLIPVMKELADGAGIDLVFADNLPDRFSIEYEATSPFEAIKAIARAEGLNLVPHNGVWILQAGGRAAETLSGGEIF